MLKHFAFLLSLAAALPAFAAEIGAESKISAVTVFPDRANVERTARFSLPAGKNAIVFDGLPSGLLTDSVRVSGRGKQKFSIGSVETKTVFQNEPAVAEERRLQEELTRLRDKRRYLEADVRAADTGKTFLEALSRSPTPPAEDAKGPSPDVWKKGWETLQSGMKTLGKEIVDKQIALRSLDADIAALQQKLNGIATGRKSYKQVRVNVEAPVAGEAEMTLQYQVFGASWTPLYEARLDSERQTVVLSQFGNISQRTGEDWKDVALTLSTAMPSVRTAPPVLTPRWLGLRKEKPVVLERAASRARMKSAAVMSNFAAVDAVSADTVFDADLEEAATKTASVSATEFSGVFVVKGASNVPADGAEYRFAIGDVSAKAEIRAEAMPALEPAAYLIATMTYDGELPMLPGTMALYRDGAFIGTASTEMLRPNEKLHLAFGQDEKIRVKFTSLGGEKTEGGMISKETRSDTLERFEVQNLHDRPLKISVYDVLPIARDGEISVSVLKSRTTKGYVEAPNNKIGTIMWESVYKPREKKTIDFGYSVSYPKDAVLTEL